MITVQEAIEKGIFQQFAEPEPAIILSSKSDLEAEKNIATINKINNLLNEEIILSKYSNNLINSLTIIYLILNPNYKGVKREERKYFKRVEKHFFIDIEIPYQAFCEADTKTALQILANNTLRCITKFLESLKNFDYQLFYNDVKNLFENENII